MKLGLKIEITSQGAGSAAKTLNSTPILEKYASASRSFIKDVFPAREDLRQKGIDANSALDESEHSVIFIRFFGPHGYLICIFQARPENSGRPYDGAAAWIHVPATVMLTGVETERLIDDVEAVLANKRGIDELKLESIFEKNLPEKKLLPAVNSIISKGESYGVRYFGSGTDFQLNELLGDGIAQPEYGKYKAVFFLRKSENIYFTGHEITTRFIPTCTIEPPTPVNDFKPYFENGAPFNQPIEATFESPIKIVWKKQGYQDIVKVVSAKPLNVEASNQTFAFVHNDIKIAVIKQWFHVYSENKPIMNYRLEVDGKKLDDVIYISESKFFSGVCVKVIADGYMSYQKDIRLSNNINIQMRRNMHHYEFSVPLYQGKDSIENGIIKIETAHKLTKSPIKGYSLNEDYLSEGEGIVNNLKQDYLEIIKYFGLGFISCLIIMLLWAGWTAMKDYDFKFAWPPIEKHKIISSPTINKPNTSVEDIKENQPIVENQDSINAISYLNHENTWCKDSLEFYTLTKGLYESLDNLNMKSLTNDWPKKLKGSSRFMDISEKARYALEMNFQLKLKSKDYRYNKTDDTKISVDKYLKWIGEDHKKDEKQNNTQKSDGSNIKGKVVSTKQNVGNKSNKRGKVK